MTDLRFRTRDEITRRRINNHFLILCDKLNKEPTELRNLSPGAVEHGHTGEWAARTIIIGTVLGDVEVRQVFEDLEDEAPKVVFRGNPAIEALLDLPTNYLHMVHIEQLVSIHDPEHNNIGLKLEALLLAINQVSSFNKVKETIKVLDNN